MYGYKQRHGFNYSALAVGYARPYHIFAILRFFRELDNDPSTRKFYRHRPCRNLREFILNFVDLLFRLTFNEFMRRFRNKYLILVVAISKTSRKIIGICHIDVMKSRTSNTMIGLYGIAILRNYRGKGLGKMLSILALRKAKELGVNVIRLTVDVDNKRAISLYRKLGFKLCRLVRKGDYRYINGEYVDYYVMEKIL